MKKFLISAAIILAASCSGRTDLPVPSVTNIQGIDVISLYGTWEEMGEQYGELAGSHLRHVSSFLSETIAGDSAKRDSIQASADKLFSRYPYRFRQFFKGMEKTSGLTLPQLVMNNAVEYVEAFFCSGLAAWGEWSSGNLVYGRNYDAVSYAPIAEDIIITVFHPSDGSLATATVGYAGEIYSVNAINEKGIFMELNNGMPSAGFDIRFERFASTTSLLEAMFDACNLDYFDAFFNTQRSFASFIIGVADANEARSYEWCATGTENATQACPPGLMVQTNHFVDSDWTFPIPADEDSWRSITRRRNLLRLAEESKGLINEDVMCRIMATPLEEGGAMNDGTRYQLVFTPATMKLLICIEQQADWVDVDLKKFFGQL